MISIKDICIKDFWSYQAYFLKTSPLYLGPTFVVTSVWLGLILLADTYFNAGALVGFLLLPLLILYLTSFELEEVRLNKDLLNLKNAWDHSFSSALLKDSNTYYLLAVFSIVSLNFYGALYMLTLDLSISGLDSFYEMRGSGEFKIDWDIVVDIGILLAVMGLMVFTLSVLYLAFLFKIYLNQIKNVKIDILKSLKLSFMAFSKHVKILMICIALFYIWGFSVLMTLMVLLPLMMKWISSNAFFIVKGSIDD